MFARSMLDDASSERKGPDLGVKGSSRMTEMLDTIDNVRSSLGNGLRDNNEIFYEKLLASLPQFVACGPQSAG